MKLSTLIRKTIARMFLKNPPVIILDEPTAIDLVEYL